MLHFGEAKNLIKIAPNRFRKRCIAFGWIAFELLSLKNWRVMVIYYHYYHYDKTLYGTHFTSNPILNGILHFWQSHQWPNARVADARKINYINIDNRMLKTLIVLTGGFSDFYHYYCYLLWILTQWHSDLSHSPYTRFTVIRRSHSHRRCCSKSFQSTSHIHTCVLV